VRRETAYGGARNPAAEFDGRENLFHSVDRGARKGFAVEPHVESALLRIADLDGGSVLSGAAEEKIAQGIARA